MANSRSASWSLAHFGQDTTTRYVSETQAGMGSGTDGSEARTAKAARERTKQFMRTKNFYETSEPTVYKSAGSMPRHTKNHAATAKSPPRPAISFGNDRPGYETEQRKTFGRAPPRDTSTAGVREQHKVAMRKANFSLGARDPVADPSMHQTTSQLAHPDWSQQAAPVMSSDLKARLRKSSLPQGRGETDYTSAAHASHGRPEAIDQAVVDTDRLRRVNFTIGNAPPAFETEQSGIGRGVHAVHDLGAVNPDLVLARSQRKTEGYVPDRRTQTTVISYGHDEWTPSTEQAEEMVPKQSSVPVGDATKRMLQSRKPNFSLGHQPRQTETTTALNFPAHKPVQRSPLVDAGKTVSINFGHDSVQPLSSYSDTFQRHSLPPRWTGTPSAKIVSVSLGTDTSPLPITSTQAAHGRA